jgi:two-component system nitrogen regulation response regulator NtrX
MSHDILVVDDEKDIRDLVTGILLDEGYKPRSARDGVTALEEIRSRQPSLVILDVWLGDSERDGIKILEIIKRDHPYVPVVMISGHANIETAVSAIKKGAYDFIEKPFQVDRLLFMVQRALESSHLKIENANLKVRSATSHELIGNSSVFNQLKQSIQRCVESQSRILLTGPSGSGKETIAKYIHGLSSRSQGLFHSLSCSSFHPDKLEAELFGLEVSSGDGPRKIGLLEQAHNGTLFIEDVADMALPTQGKLVKFLQDKTFCRLGSSKPAEVDVRIIASSKVELRNLIQTGDFREDLYYRLNVNFINVPALKERVTDIPLLCDHFMDVIARAYNLPKRRLSEETIMVLQSYPWPGNIRQLKNVLEWVYIMNKNEAREPVSVQELPPEIVTGNQFSVNWNQKSADIVALPLRDAREAFEREYLFAQVHRFGGNISQTARFVGMERSALHRKLKALSDGKNVRDLIKFDEEDVA